MQLRPSWLLNAVWQAAQPQYTMYPTASHVPHCYNKPTTISAHVEEIIYPLPPHQCTSPSRWHSQRWNCY